MSFAVTPSSATCHTMTPVGDGLGRVSAFNRPLIKKRSDATEFSIRWRTAKPIRDRLWTDEDFDTEAERLDDEIAAYIAANGLTERDDASKNGVFRSSEPSPEAEKTTPKLDISKFLN